MNWPIKAQCKRMHSSYGSGLHNLAKSVPKINTLFFMIALSYKTGFLTFKSAISLLLDPINPFATNNMLLRIWRNKGPCALFNKCINLCTHGTAPSRVTIWLWETCRWGCSLTERDEKIRFSNYIGDGNHDRCGTVIDVFVMEVGQYLGRREWKKNGHDQLKKNLHRLPERPVGSLERASSLSGE